MNQTNHNQQPII